MSNQRNPDDLGLPEALRDLPSFSFSRSRPSTRVEAANKDVAYGVKSMADVLREAERRLVGRPPSKSVTVKKR